MGANLVGFFDRIAEDERLLALGFCSDAGQLLHATKRWSPNVDCASVARTKNDTLATVFDAGRRLLVSAFPMSAGPVRGHFIILHDLRFVDERAGKARLYAATALVGGMVGIGLLAAAIMLGALRGWSQVVRSALADLRHGIEPTTRSVDLLPITSEMRLLLRDFRADRREGDGLQVQWSPQTLHLLLEERLPDTEVIAVSNREPYIHNRNNGSVALQIPASGLVAALEPVMRACRRQMDRSRQRQPTARRSTRATISGCPRRSRLYAAAGMAERGRAGWLLLRLCQRRPLAAVPHCLRAANIPARGLAAICGDQPTLCRRGGAGGEVATIRSC